MVDSTQFSISILANFINKKELKIYSISYHLWTIPVSSNVFWPNKYSSYLLEVNE